MFIFKNVIKILSNRINITIYIIYIIIHEGVLAMDNTHKIIIVALIGIIIVLGGAMLGTLLKEPSKTVELFENGTTIVVSQNTVLESHDEFSTTYITDKNTSIIGVENNNLVGALASKMLSGLIVENGELQDNGLYKLDKKSIIQISDQLGLEHDESKIKEAYVAIKHNNTVNQTIIIMGMDEQEIISIMNSIHWKQGIQSNITNSTEIGNFTPSSGSDTAVPQIADEGSADDDYIMDYDDEVDDSYDDYESDSSSSDIGSSSSSSQSQSSSVETTADDSSSSSSGVETTVNE
jgi:hypothetical protein